MRIVGLAAGPEASGRTGTAVAAVLHGVPDADTELLELTETSLDSALSAVGKADAVVFGSPVYRATYSGILILQRQVVMSALVVAGAGSGLASSSPVGPVQDVADGVSEGAGDAVE